MKLLAIIAILACIASAIAVKAGGTARVKGVTPRPKRLSFMYGLRMFFSTLVDPTSVESAKHAPVDRTSKSGRSKKGKGSKLGSSSFQPMGGAGGSFGAVCGPNGCN